MANIGKNIKLLRTEKGMTQDELAEKLFVTRQTVSNYETGKSKPDVEMLLKIAEVLDTDVQQLIYGPQPKTNRTDLRQLLIGAVVTCLLTIAWLILQPRIRRYVAMTFNIWPNLLLYGLLQPLLWLSAAWTMAQLVISALRLRIPQRPWQLWLRRGLAAVLVIWLVLTMVSVVLYFVEDWSYEHKVWGHWEERTYDADGVEAVGQHWIYEGPSVPDGLRNMIFVLNMKKPWVLGLLGIGLAACTLPPKRISQ